MNGGVQGTELSIVAGNVQMLLVAPDGKETGFDPKTKKKLRTIPNSAYSEDALLVYDSGRADPNTTQTINVQRPITGQYELIVSSGTAANGEDYEIHVNFYLQDGGEARTARIAGTAERGETATYQIQVIGDPAGVLVKRQDKFTR